MYIPQYDIYKGILSFLSAVLAVIFMPQYVKSKKERHTKLSGIILYFLVIPIVALILGGTSVSHAELKNIDKLNMEAILGNVLCFSFIYIFFEALFFSNKDSWRLHSILFFSGLSIFYFVSIFGIAVIE